VQTAIINRVKRRFAAVPTCLFCFCACALAQPITVSAQTSEMPLQNTDVAHADQLAGVATIPGMPPVIDPKNLYGEAASGKLSPAVTDALARVYVPNVLSNEIYVINPTTLAVIDHFKVGRRPQHVVPSWDLKTLWITGSSRRHARGSLMPIDPFTGKPGKPIKVPDAYNMYFTPEAGPRLWSPKA
jgi:YVTN family beta-propeller protein